MVFMNLGDYVSKTNQEGFDLDVIYWAFSSFKEVIKESLKRIGLRKKLQFIMKDVKQGTFGIEVVTGGYDYMTHICDPLNGHLLKRRKDQRVVTKEVRESVACYLERSVREDMNGVAYGLPVLKVAYFDRYTMRLFYRITLDKDRGW